MTTKMPSTRSDASPKFFTARQRWLLLSLCGVALLLRLGVIVALEAWHHPNAMEHRVIAANLVLGRGFSFADWGYFGLTSFQSPPYPLLLAGLFQIFGIDSPAAYAVALCINAVFGAVCVWLTARCAQVMGATSHVALLTAALVAIWPTQIYAVAHAQAIALITAATLAVIWLWYRSLDTGRVGPWIAFSIIGCVGALTEPVLLPPMVLSGLAVLVWRSRLTSRQRLRNALLLLAAGLLILGPWTLRNYHVHGKLMPVKSGFWVNVWKANNDHATGTDRLPLTDEQLAALLQTPLWEREELARDPEFDSLRQYDMLTEAQTARLEGKPEVEREKVFNEFVTTWVRENPGRYIELCGIRLIKTLWIEWDNPKSYNLVYLGSRTVVLVLSIAGLIIAFKRRWRLGYAGLVLGLALLLYTLTITAARFILPFEPLLLCLAALPIAAVAAWAWSADDPAAEPREEFAG